MTPKQEKFCIEYVKTGNKSEAYRIAYDTSKMTDKSINESACQMFNDLKITSRVEELRITLEEKELYTLEQSIKRDLNLIHTYEAALEVLQDLKSEKKDIITAERTIKYIGASGYNSAQERLSKQSGWFEKDNKQKNAPSFVMFDGRKKK